MSSNSTVKLYPIQTEHFSHADRTEGSGKDLVEVHNMIDYDVMCTDIRASPDQLVVGLYSKVSQTLEIEFYVGN